MYMSATGCVVLQEPPIKSLPFYALVLRGRYYRVTAVLLSSTIHIHLQALSRLTGTNSTHCRTCIGWHCYNTPFVAHCLWRALDENKLCRNWSCVILHKLPNREWSRTSSMLCLWVQFYTVTVSVNNTDIHLHALSRLMGTNCTRYRTCIGWLWNEHRSHCRWVTSHNQMHKTGTSNKKLDDNNNLLLSPNSLVIITHNMQLNKYNHNRIWE